MRVANSDHSTNPVCGFGSAKPVLHGTNNTEPNLFHHGETTYRVGWLIWICYSRALERKCLLRENHLTKLDRAYWFARGRLRFANCLHKQKLATKSSGTIRERSEGVKCFTTECEKKRALKVSFKFQCRFLVSWNLTKFHRTKTTATSRPSEAAWSLVQRQYLEAILPPGSYFSCFWACDKRAP